MGGVAFLAVFVPDYGHFRSGAVIGILTTTITSLYMFIASLSFGQVLSLSLLPLLQTEPPSFNFSTPRVCHESMELCEFCDQCSSIPEASFCFEFFKFINIFFWWYRHLELSTLVQRIRCSFSRAQPIFYSHLEGMESPYRQFSAQQ